MNYQIVLFKQFILDSISYIFYKIGFKKTGGSFLKRQELDKIIKKYNIKYMVESGTFLGETVQYFKNKLNHIYSIELSKNLFDFNKNRFSNYQNITILQGDSGSLMADISQQLTEKTLFFLDGHYSGGFTAKADSECPLIGEIKGIGRSSYKKHIIIIDDYRLIGNHKDYPSLKEIEVVLHDINKNYTLKINKDMLICVV